MNQMSWCGPPPCPPGNPWGGLEQCWNDVAALEALLTKIITDMLAKDPNAFGTQGTIKGVTDGSAAPPGAVGEIVTFAGVAPFPINTPGTPSVALTTMGTLPAGDWMIWAWASVPFAIEALSLDNIPTTDTTLPPADQNALIPAGMGWMGMALGGMAGESFALPTIVSSYRGAGPVQVILRTAVQSTVAGHVDLGFEARRVR